MPQIPIYNRQHLIPKEAPQDPELARLGGELGLATQRAKNADMYNQFAQHGINTFTGVATKLMELQNEENYNDAMLEFKKRYNDFQLKILEDPDYKNHPQKFQQFIEQNKGELLRMVPGNLQNKFDYTIRNFAEDEGFKLEYDSLIRWRKDVVKHATDTLIPEAIKLQDYDMIDDILLSLESKAAITITEGDEIRKGAYKSIDMTKAFSDAFQLANEKGFEAAIQAVQEYDNTRDNAKYKYLEESDRGQLIQSLTKAWDEQQARFKKELLAAREKEESRLMGLMTDDALTRGDIKDAREKQLHGMPVLSDGAMKMFDGYLDAQDKEAKRIVEDQAVNEIENIIYQIQDNGFNMNPSEFTNVLDRIDPFLSQEKRSMMQQKYTEMYNTYKDDIAQKDIETALRDRTTFDQSVYDRVNEEIKLFPADEQIKLKEKADKAMHDYNHRQSKLYLENFANAGIFRIMEGSLGDHTRYLTEDEIIQFRNASDKSAARDVSFENFALSQIKSGFIRSEDDLKQLFSDFTKAKAGGKLPKDFNLDRSFYEMEPAAFTKLSKAMDDYNKDYYQKRADREFQNYANAASENNKNITALRALKAKLISGKDAYYMTNHAPELRDRMLQRIDGLMKEMTQGTPKSDLGVVKDLWYQLWHNPETAEQLSRGPDSKALQALNRGDLTVADYKTFIEDCNKFLEGQTIPYLAEYIDKMDTYISNLAAAWRANHRIKPKELERKLQMLYTFTPEIQRRFVDRVLQEDLNDAGIRAAFNEAMDSMKGAVWDEVGKDILGNLTAPTYKIDNRWTKVDKNEFTSGNVPESIYGNDLIEFTENGKPTGKVYRRNTDGTWTKVYEYNSVTGNYDKVEGVQ